MTPAPSPSSPHPEDEDHEVDHTGIRELLRSLPDPGPMPDDLVARIEARLAVEQAHRAHNSAPATPAHRMVAGDRVVDLAAERGRRRPARTMTILGAAAGGLLVTTIAMSQLGGGSGPGNDTAAYAPPGSTESRAGEHSSDDAAGGAAQDGESGAEDGQAGAADAATADSGTESSELLGEGADGDDAGAESADAAATDEGIGGLSATAADVAVLDDLGALDADWATTMSAAVDAWESPAENVNFHVAQANSCWSAAFDGGSQDGASVDEAAFDERFAALGEYDDEPVVVLLGRESSGSGVAVLMPASCRDSAESEPLARAEVQP
ncbi:hypothetical protein ACQBAT_15785 [Ornithinimicrobium sp. Y1847]|uniref:hypothetical protein n=1 Tax=unclassified Ornithinimicrobium TaxID=2615080 RepID=UPI003B67F0CC